MRRATIEVSTDGNTDVVNITARAQALVANAQFDGVLHLFVVGSTAAITTLEYEPGLVKHDLKNVLQRLAPDDAVYEHEQTWNDDNGHSHVRAALMGPSLSVPFGRGRLLLGDYQQIVLVDFDTRPRRRTVVATLLG